MGNSKKRKVVAGDIYALHIQKLDRYCAYQILAVDRSGIIILGLDYFEKELPAAEMLDGLDPFRKNRYGFQNEICKSGIEIRPIPEDYIYLGNYPLKNEPVSRVYSESWPVGEEYIYEYEWNSLDESIRTAYKSNKKNPQKVVLGRKYFLSHESVLTTEMLSKMESEKDTALFPCLLHADIKGYHDLLDIVLENSVLISRLVLEEPDVQHIDLSKTHLRDVEIDVTGVKSLILPKNVRFLKLSGEIDEELWIDNQQCKESFTVLFATKNAKVKRYGLEKRTVGYLTLQGQDEVDLDVIVEEFPELGGFYFEGNPGTIKNFDALQNLKGLNCINLTDMFGYGEEEMKVLETLPNLKYIDFESIPKAAGMYLKQNMKGKLEKFRVTALRDEEWMKDNMENPLRHWDGDEFIPRRAYLAAIKCYKKTKKAFISAQTREEIINVVKNYTMDFNQLNEKYDEFIETIERDDVYDAMKILYAKCPCQDEISLGEVWDIMDDMRDMW